jgi:hypothetical protein
MRSCAASLWSDALDLVDLLLSEYPRPREKHMIVKLKHLQTLMDGDAAFRAQAIKDRLAHMASRDVHTLLMLALSTKDLLGDLPSVPVHLTHIRGVINPADYLTKSMDTSSFVSMFLRDKSCVQVDAACRPSGSCVTGTPKVSNSMSSPVVSKFSSVKSHLNVPVIDLSQSRKCVPTSAPQHFSIGDAVGTAKVPRVAVGSSVSLAPRGRDASVRSTLPRNGRAVSAPPRLHASSQRVSSPKSTSVVKCQPPVHAYALRPRPCPKPTRFDPSTAK